VAAFATVYLAACAASPGPPPHPPPAVADGTSTWPSLQLPALLDYELRQFATLNGQTVNAREAGARGDGSADDTAALQAALDAADGGTLYLPAGRYLIGSLTLRPGARVRLLGDGQGATILKHANGASQSMLVSSPQPVGQLQVERLTLDGNQGNVAWTASAIEVRADRFLLQDVEATRTMQQAVRVRTTTYTSVIRDSWFHDYQLHGPQLNQDTRAVQIDHDLPSDGDVWFVGNRVEMTTPPAGPGNSVGGFRSSGDLNTRLFVLNNVFRNIGQDMADLQEYIAAIDIYRNGDGSIIQGNSLYNSYYDPIRVMRSNNVRVLDNLVDGQGQISSDAGAGIHGEGRKPHVAMRGIIIRGNTVRNLPDLSAIRGEYDADGPARDLNISANTISRVKDGIYLSFVGGQVVVEDNQVDQLTTPWLNPLRITNVDPSAPINLRADGNSWDLNGLAGGPGGSAVP
jgi:Pectate lyase superfamily protein